MQFPHCTPHERLRTVFQEAYGRKSWSVERNAERDQTIDVQIVLKDLQGCYKCNAYSA